MGLDMYLYCNSKQLTKEVNSLMYPTQGSDRIDWAEWYSKRGIIMYWRKANAIHKWFVENVQDGKDDCGTYDVEADQLKALLEACESVLADRSLADELLPTEDGFFFGSTDYDEWYFEGLEYTATALRRILGRVVSDDESPWYCVLDGEPDWYVTFQYHSSW